MSAGGETTRNKPTNPSKSDLLCKKNFAGCFSLSFEKGFRFSRPRPTVLYTYIDVFKLYLNDYAMYISIIIKLHRFFNRRPMYMHFICPPLFVFTFMKKNHTHIYTNTYAYKVKPTNLLKKWLLIFFRFVLTGIAKEAEACLCKLVLSR